MPRLKKKTYLQRKDGLADIHILKKESLHRVTYCINFITSMCKMSLE